MKNIILSILFAAFISDVSAFNESALKKESVEITNRVVDGILNARNLPSGNDQQPLRDAVLALRGEGNQNPTAEQILLRLNNLPETPTNVQFIGDQRLNARNGGVSQQAIDNFVAEQAEAAARTNPQNVLRVSGLPNDDDYIAAVRTLGITQETWAAANEDNKNIMIGSIIAERRGLNLTSDNQRMIVFSIKDLENQGVPITMDMIRHIEGVDTHRDALVLSREKKDNLKLIIQSVLTEGLGQNGPGSVPLAIFEVTGFATIDGIPEQRVITRVWTNGANIDGAAYTGPIDGSQAPAPPNSYVATMGDTNNAEVGDFIAVGGTSVSTQNPVSTRLEGVEKYNPIIQ